MFVLLRHFKSVVLFCLLSINLVAVVTVGAYHSNFGFFTTFDILPFPYWVINNSLPLSQHRLLSGPLQSLALPFPFFSLFCFLLTCAVCFFSAFCFRILYSLVYPRIVLFRPVDQWPYLLFPKADSFSFFFLFSAASSSINQRLSLFSSSAAIVT